MNENTEEEKKCPICDKTIRSDAAIKEFCKLCGMGIPEPLGAPKLRTKKGTLFFCCDKCLLIYEKNIPKK